PARMRTIARRSRGFLYVVSLTGVTGERQELPRELADQMRELRALTTKPLCVGFGISRPDQAAQVARLADGVIGGSAIVRPFEERESGLRTVDPLRFKDTRAYRDRVRAAREKTGLEEAVITGLARIGGFPTVLCVFEFAFLGGSMGSVVGEKLTRAIELAIDKHLPVIIVSASGGARMQEGILSLMQMAKTSAALERLGARRLPYVSVLTDPTT